MISGSFLLDFVYALGRKLKVNAEWQAHQRRKEV